jgi:hypothetical protein
VVRSGDFNLVSRNGERAHFSAYFEGVSQLLKVEDGMKTEFDPPTHLSPRAKSLWAQLVPSRARSAGRLALLTAALEAMDRAEQARLELAAATLTTTTETTKAVHVHPLVKVEREARQQFAVSGRIWRLDSIITRTAAISKRGCGGKRKHSDEVRGDLTKG